MQTSATPVILKLYPKNTERAGARKQTYLQRDCCSAHVKMCKSQQVHKNSNAIWVHEILNVFLKQENIFAQSKAFLINSAVTQHTL